jgi:hypothetical protein
MRDAFIITPSSFGLRDFIAEAERAGHSPVMQGATVSIGEDNDHIDIREAPEMLTLLDEDERKHITVCGPLPRSLHLRYRTRDGAKRAILTFFPSRPNFLLDNDHGLLVPLDRFSNVVRNHEDWDWTMADDLPL